MNLMLGARATTDVIRHGAPKAEIEGLFSFENSRAVKQVLTDQGIEVADELIIRREILPSNGRSVSRVNGQMVNLSVLKQIGQHLVDIHGQHDQEELMKAQYHIQLLDSFGDDEFWNLKEDYQTQFEAYRQLKRELLRSVRTRKTQRLGLKCWSTKLPKSRQLI